jgi:hypothetical protein
MISLTEKTPKVLFVNPRFPRSLWGFQGMQDIVDVRCGQSPLGLATVAALTPRDIPVELQDENAGPISLDTDATCGDRCWNSTNGRKSCPRVPAPREAGRRGWAVPDAVS